MGTLCDQLAGFFPRVRVGLDAECRYRVFAEPGGRRPVAVCPTSGRGMGEPFLRKAGFRPTGRDGAGNQIHSLDAQVIDAARFDRTRVAITKDRRVLEIAPGAIRNPDAASGEQVVAGLATVRLVQRYQAFHPSHASGETSSEIPEADSAKKELEKTEPLEDNN